MLVSPDTKVLNTINAFFLHVLYSTELLIRISRIRLTKVLLYCLKGEICIKRRPKFYRPKMFTHGQYKGWQKFKRLSETRINHCKFQMSIFRKKLHEYTCATFRVLKVCKYYGKNYKPIFTPVPWWSWRRDTTQRYFECLRVIYWRFTPAKTVAF